MESEAESGRHDDMSKSIPQITKHFNVIKKIGEGTFSSVYLVKHKTSLLMDAIAVKYIVPTCKPARTENELECLLKFSGKNNVMGLMFAVRHEGFVGLAMPFFPHDKFQSYSGSLTIDEIRDYMKNLFIALAHVHSFNIIHRDIKPSNFLYNRKLKRYALVDFGLAQRVKSPIYLSNVSNSTPLHRTRSITNENKRSYPDSNFDKKSETYSPMKKRIALGQINPHNSSSRPPNTKPLFKTEIIEDWTPQPPKSIGFTRLDLNQSSADTPSNLKISSLDSTTRFRHDTLHKNHLNQSTKNVKNNQVLFKCRCYGVHKVCRVCLNRRKLTAARAGTAGFRAPEVLLKHQYQTTAIDVWAAGIILLSFLSDGSSFFTAGDDLMCLGEIITVFGSNAVKETAIKIGKHLTISSVKPPLDLKKICLRLRHSEKNSKPVARDKTVSRCHRCGCRIINNDCICLKSEITFVKEDNSPMIDPIPDSAFNLLHQLLTLDPNARITADTALHHPFLNDINFV